jgi:large subunit ribosomal protein L22
MGASKKNKAEKIKEDKKDIAIAKLNNCPTSPRKMRLVADLVRGENIYAALNILRYNPKHASKNIEKLLLSAINNWEQKNEGSDPVEANLIVKEIYVDSARMLKRIQAAPQGRAHRIRKRSNHVTLIIDKGKK